MPQFSLERVISKSRIMQSGCRRKHHPEDLWLYVIYHPYNLESLPLLLGRTWGWPPSAIPNSRAITATLFHFFLPLACPQLGSSFASSCCYRRVYRGEFSARKSITGFSSWLKSYTLATILKNPEESLVKDHIKTIPLVKHSSNKEVKCYLIWTLYTTYVWFNLCPSTHAAIRCCFIFTTLLSLISQNGKCLSY